MEKTTEIITIKCPYCGAEYTLDEIFLPKYILGKSKDIIKDPAGKILFTNFNIEPELSEVFNCDYCHKDFNTALVIKTTSTAINEELDFSTERTSLF